MRGKIKQRLFGIKKIACPSSDSLTIFIPSKGRPKELTSLLSYFAKKKLTVKILILESGSSYQPIVQSYPNLNIELHTCDPGLTISKKFLLGATLIKTPLVCLCADDDLVLVDAIEQCAAFLLANPDYSVCQGYHGFFDNASNDSFDLMNIPWYASSLENNDPLKRLHSLITRYHPVCWAVFRTKTFLKTAKNFLRVTTPLFFELTWAAHATINGKVKRLPILYCMRKNDTLNKLGHPLYLFMESPALFLKEYQLYRKGLEKALISSIPLTELQRALDLMHSCLFYDSATRGELQFMAREVLEKPSLSILDSEIHHGIKHTSYPFDKTNHLSVEGKTRKYRVSKEFIQPQPAEEIHLNKNFYYSLIEEFDDYVLGD